MGEPIPIHPIGTIEQCEAAGLDPSIYPTCAQPSKDDHIVGCKKWFSCKLRGAVAHEYDFQGDVIRGKSGPQIFGIQTLANKTVGKRVINRNAPCWELPDLALEADATRGSKYSKILRIIARQGGTFVTSCYGPQDEQIPGGGMRRTWHPTTVLTKVPVFPKPSENPALQPDRFVTEEAARFFEQQAGRDTSEFFGGRVATQPKPVEETTPDPSSNPTEGTEGTQHGRNKRGQGGEHARG